MEALEAQYLSLTGRQGNMGVDCLLASVEEAGVGFGLFRLDLETVNSFELPQPQEEVVGLGEGPELAEVEDWYFVVEK